jgi:hypothetical protein
LYVLLSSRAAYPVHLILLVLVVLIIDVELSRQISPVLCYLSLLLKGGHYATSWKVAYSIPDEVTGFFNLPNPSSRTVALGSTHPLTEMSTRNLPGG